MYDKMKNTSNKTFRILIYILNGWEITKIILAKQKSSSNETKIKNKK